MRERVVGWFWRKCRARWFSRARWPNVFLALFALGAAGYVGTATLAFGYVRYHRGIEAARWVDIALPWRWSHYRVARGDHHLAHAGRLRSERKFREALMFARAGLALSPANRDGRILLAEMLQASRRLESAQQILLEGLPLHHADAVYVNAVLIFLLQQQEDLVLVPLAREYLRTESPGPTTARLFALAAATASYFRGHYDQAEDFLRQIPRVQQSIDSRLLSAKIEFDRGHRALALMRLRSLVEERPDDVELHHELVAHLRDTGQANEARRLSLEFQIAHPALAGPRIDLLQAYREAGDAARVTEEAGALLRDFPGDQTVLLALADFAANDGEIELADRLVEHAKNRSLPVEPFALLAIEARIVVGEYQAAADAVRTFQTQNPDTGARFHSVLASLQAIARLGLGDQQAARAFFADFMSSLDLRADNLLALANRCAALGAGDIARQLLSRSLELEPKNQAVLTRLTQLDWEFNEISALAGHVRQLLTTRRPSPDLLRVAQYKLGSDLLLFSREAQTAQADLEALLKTSRP